MVRSKSLYWLLETRFNVIETCYIATKIVYILKQRNMYIYCCNIFTFMNLSVIILPLVYPQKIYRWSNRMSYATIINIINKVNQIFKTITAFYLFRASAQMGENQTKLVGQYKVM
jgi:hypothetical protein